MFIADPLIDKMSNEEMHELIDCLCRLSDQNDEYVNNLIDIENLYRELCEYYRMNREFAMRRKVSQNRVFDFIEELNKKYNLYTEKTDAPLPEERIIRKQEE